MRATSLIFLVFSLILFVGGFMLCGIAKSMAAADDIQIYDQAKNENGDYIYRYDIPDDTITRITLTFSDVKVNIKSTTEKSYIELKNFDVNSYKTTLTSGSVTIDGTVNIVSALVDMSGGGIQFKGIRHFLLDKPASDSERSVDLYISQNSELQTLTIRSDKGDISLSSISAQIDYNINATNCNVELNKMKTTSVADINITNGNAKISASEINTLDVNIDGGNFELSSDGAYSAELTSYSLVSLDGSVVYNGLESGTELKVTSPAPNYIIKANVSGGIISVKDA